MTRKYPENTGNPDRVQNLVQFDWSTRKHIWWPGDNQGIIFGGPTEKRAVFDFRLCISNTRVLDWHICCWDHADFDVCRNKA